ncbi:MAG: PQQ-dependent sugar dehydrogenase [Candidatus Nitrosocaldaceae archaeon]
MNFSYQIVADNLNYCGTTFEFLPDGRIICGDLKSGDVHIIENGTLLKKPLLKVNVYHSTKPSGIFDERGLIGLEVDPDFNNNRYVYLHWTYWDDIDRQSYRKIARFLLENDTLVNMKVLLDKIPASYHHNGGPLEVGPDGYLYITGGDAAIRDNSTAQDLNSLTGKIFRIDREGNIPKENPFPRSPIYTYGHRNVFGIAFHPITSKPYISENGPDNNDELNILEAGKDYGWPKVVGYSGLFTDPIYSWESVIAPTEMIFYTKDIYGEDIKNNLFLLSYNLASIFRIELEGDDYDKVKSINIYNYTESLPLIDIEEGPDGYIYISNFNTIYKIVPKSKILTSLEVESRNIDGKIVVYATITDLFGNKLNGLPINFTMVEGDNNISTIINSSNGSAVAYFTPVGNEYIITVIFEGNDKYDGSKKIIDNRTILLEKTIKDIKVQMTIKSKDAIREFSIKFINITTNGLLNDVSYEFTVKNGNNIIFAGDGLGSRIYILAIEELNNLTFEINDINGGKDSVTFNINDIPEFTSTLIVLSILFIFSTLYIKRDKSVYHI